MELVSKKEFQELINYNRIGKDVFADVVFQLLKINKVNELYKDHYEKSPHDFIDAILHYLGIHYKVSTADLKRIPETGSFVIISNHPFGALDGLLLYKIISEKRPDFKIMANFLLQRIEPLKDCFFPVNPFNNTKKDIKSSVKGLRNAMDHVINDHPLGIFPAGEVSTINFPEKRISDKAWDKGIIKFVVNCESPIIPIFISGNNSPMFHALGQIHPLLRTAKLPSELFNKKDKTIQIRIGKPVTEHELKRFGNYKDLGNYLRVKTYSLGNSLDIDAFYSKHHISPKKQESVIEAIDNQKLIDEIDKIKEDSLLFEMGQYSALCASTDKIPNLIIEIGRLREITFREVDEGTNKSIDLDHYDVYYQHLIIWDNAENRLVGAYRIGKGKDIIDQYGIKGLYVRSLFKIDKALKGILEQSIELGRSFIVKDYQKKALPLFMLWKGILCFLIKHPDYRYLIGPVSISNRFSRFSKSLIVSFVKSNYFNEGYARYIKPKRDFKIPRKHMPEINTLLESLETDIDDIDSIVNEIENDKRIPVLLKKYLSLNAQIIGFNVDPLFNDCLDGLLLLDLMNVPHHIVTSLSKDLQNEKSELSQIDLLRSRIVNQDAEQ